MLLFMNFAIVLDALFSGPRSELSSPYAWRYSRSWLASWICLGPEPSRVLIRFRMVLVYVNVKLMLILVLTLGELQNHGGSWLETSFGLGRMI